MAKTNPYVVALFLAIIGFGDAVVQAEEFLYCRGPLSYGVGTGGQTTVVFIKKNDSAAGQNGISLQPGMCAWADRTLASGEPTKVFMVPETWLKTRPAFIAFTACAGDTRCVVNFQASNANDANNPHFKAQDSFVMILYPAFPLPRIPIPIPRSGGSG